MPVNAGGYSPLATPFAMHLEIPFIAKLAALLFALQALTTLHLMGLAGTFPTIAAASVYLAVQPLVRAHYARQAVIAEQRDSFPSSGTE